MPVLYHAFLDSVKIIKSCFIYRTNIFFTTPITNVPNDCLTLASARGHIPSSDGGGNGAGSLMHSLEGTRDRANEAVREGGKGHEMSFCGGGGGRKRKMKVARASNHGSLARSLTHSLGHSPLSVSAQLPVCPT